MTLFPLRSKKSEVLKSLITTLGSTSYIQNPMHLQYEQNVKLLHEIILCHVCSELHRIHQGV